MEENVTTNPAEGERENASPDLGKFKSVDALLRAYGELEAEFTRRSQRLKAFEDEREKTQSGHAEQSDDDLLRAVNQNEGVRARVVSEYLSSLKGVPLMTGSGGGVTAPPNRPKTFSEAGSLALGYLKNNQK